MDKESAEKEAYLAAKEKFQKVKREKHLDEIIPQFLWNLSKLSFAIFSSYWVGMGGISIFEWMLNHNWLWFWWELNRDIISAVIGFIFGGFNFYIIKKAILPEGLVDLWATFLLFAVFAAAIVYGIFENIGLVVLVLIASGFAKWVSEGNWK